MHVRRDRSPVFRITEARRGISDDIAYRQRRYAISMLIRTVCFILAVVTDGWLRALFFAAALLLPYFAVVFANGGREPAPEPPATLLETYRPELGSGGEPGHGDRDL